MRQIVYFRTHYYRPQTKFAKVMFLYLSVSHSVHGGGDICLCACWDTNTPPWANTPWSRHAPTQCILGRYGNKRAVCILLECILVYIVTEWASENYIMNILYQILIYEGMCCWLTHCCSVSVILGLTASWNIVPVRSGTTHIGRDWTAEKFRKLKILKV